MGIFSRKSRDVEVQPEISEKRISDKESFERQLYVYIQIKDYTGENLVTKSILNTAYERMQSGTLSKYMNKKFPDKELKVNVTRTPSQIKGTVYIRNPKKKRHSFIKL